MPSTERQILLAPDVVARAAIRLVDDPEQRWMLRQSRDVRRSYAEQVLDRADEDLLQQAWMLRQSDDVRRSFIDDVLLEQDPPPRQEIWMLRQSREVRESFVAEVLLAEGEVELDLGPGDAGR